MAVLAASLGGRDFFIFFGVVKCSTKLQTRLAQVQPWQSKLYLTLRAAYYLIFQYYARIEIFYERTKGSENFDYFSFR